MWRSIKTGVGRSYLNSGWELPLGGKERKEHGEEVYKKGLIQWEQIKCVSALAADPTPVSLFSLLPHGKCLTPSMVDKLKHPLNDLWSREDSGWSLLLGVLFVLLDGVCFFVCFLTFV